MNKRMVVFTVLFGALLTFFECAAHKQENGLKTNLTRTEVLGIAGVAAKSNGYDVRKYNMTGCHYEFIRKDHTWTVCFELKPPTPPGGHFMVSVDDQTKESILMRGE